MMTTNPKAQAIQTFYFPYILCTALKVFNVIPSTDSSMAQLFQNSYLSYTHILYNVHTGLHFLKRQSHEIVGMISISPASTLHSQFF